MNTDSKIATTKTALKSQKILIAKIQKDIEAAPNFESAQALQVDLNRAQFELQAGEKSLAVLEQQADEESHASAVETYNAQLSAYNSKLVDYDQHEAAAVTALAALNVAFAAHFKLYESLRYTHDKLAVESTRLGLQAPPFVPYGSPDAAEHVFQMVKRADDEGYVSKLLSVQSQPIMKGGWINSGPK